MVRILSLVAAVVFFGHGLIHLMGTAVYAGHVQLSGLPYKTTLLGGHWGVGESGMAVFGALWLLPAAGFVIAAIELLMTGAMSLPLLFASSAMSLALISLDSSSAFAGGVVDLVILAVVIVASRAGALL